MESRNKSNHKTKSFQDLKAWQAAHSVVIRTYKVTEKFPKHERFGLSSQMRRAAISITSNIAEGFGRWSKNEKDQFFSVASGSTSELLNQYIAARDVGYIADELYSKIEEEITVAHKLLNGLRRANRVRNSKV